MEQHMTTLVANQSKSSTIYKARVQKSTSVKNSITLFITENAEMNENIPGIANQITKQIAKQITQMKKNDKDSIDTIAITLLENDRAEGIVIFRSVNKSNAHINGSSNIAIEVVPVTIGIKHQYQYEESQQAYKFTALMRGQLELVHWNSSTPIALQDRRRRPDEESNRQKTLKTFYRYNAISALRALENYYATKTSRYTIIQNHLLPCIGITRKKPKCWPTEDQSCQFSSLKHSQSYRIILDDGASNATAEHRNTIKDESEYKKNIVHQNSMLSEMESLKEENKQLGLALRKAADLHVSMVSTAEANLKEKYKLVEELRALEERNNDLLAKNEELRKSTIQADKLRKKKRILEKTQRVLEEDKAKFFARKDVFERFNETNSCVLRQDMALLEEQRRSVEEQWQDVLAQKKELQQLQSRTQTEARSLAVKKRSLENAQQELEQERKQFLAAKKKFELSNEVAVNRMLDKEKSLVEQRVQIERTQQNLAEDRNALQNQRKLDAKNLKEKEKMMEQNYETKNGDLMKANERMQLAYEAKNSLLQETERSIKNQRRDLASCQNKVSQQQQELNTKANGLREMQISIDAQRHDLKNCQRNLLEQQKEFKKYCEETTNCLRETQKEMEKRLGNIRLNDESCIEIPIIIPHVLSLKIKWPFV